MPGNPKKSAKKTQPKVDPEEDPDQPLRDAIEEHVDSFIKEQLEEADDLPTAGKMMPLFFDYHSCEFKSN